MTRAKSKAIVKPQSTAIGGRWTWATVENDAAIEARCRVGLDITNTCRYLGIDKKSFYDRMHRDEAFASRVRKAKAEIESDYWQRLRDIAEDPDTDAATKLKAINRVLEVINRERYGSNTSKVELTGKDGGPVQQQVQWILPPNPRVPLQAEIVQTDDDDEG